MARLTNINTGVVVNVDDAKVARLGSEWSTDGKSLQVAARSDVPDSSWKVAELKAYAEENSIDLLDATKKDDILAAIDLHESDGSADGSDEDESEEY